MITLYYMYSKVLTRTLNLTIKSDAATGSTKAVISGQPPSIAMFSTLIKDLIWNAGTITYAHLANNFQRLIITRL